MRSSIIRTAFAQCVALACVSVAFAQCPPTPTGVFVEWSACNNGPRVNWSVPPGQLYYPRVFRSLTPNVNDATLAVTASLNTTSAIDESAPPNTDLYYWVEFGGINAQCTLGPKAGPVLGRRISLGSTTFAVPAPSITVQCDGVTLQWPRIRENLNGGLVLRRFSINPNTQVDVPLPLNATSYRDTSGTPGVVYGYNVYFLNTCRGTEGTEASTTRFPPFADQPQPQGSHAIAGTNASITVDYGVVSPAVGLINWFKLPAMTPMQTDGRVVVVGRFLSFNPVLESDEGLYLAVPAGGCAVPRQTQVGLIVRKACPADFNGSGGSTIQDVFDFLTAWFSGCQ